MKATLMSEAMNRKKRRGVPETKMMSGMSSEKESMKANKDVPRANAPAIEIEIKTMLEGAKKGRGNRGAITDSGEKKMKMDDPSYMIDEKASVEDQQKRVDFLRNRLKKRMPKG